MVTEATPALVNRLLVALFLITFHIRFLDNLPIPYVVPFSCAFLLLLSNVRIPTESLLTILLIVFVAFACAILAPRSEYMFARLVSTAYFAISLTAGSILFTELASWPRVTVARWAGYASTLLLIGCLLETAFPIFRNLSDAYREWNFSTPYANAARDLKLHGILRPNFFTSEPSHIGQNAAFTLTLWIFTTSAKQRILMFAAASAIAIFLIRSPTLLVLPGVIAMYSVFIHRQGIFARMSFGSRLLMLMPIGCVLLSSLTLLAWGLFGPRLADILSGRDGSTVVRLIGSFALTDDLLAQSPFIGIGVGGTDAYANDVIYPYFAQFSSIAIDYKARIGTVGDMIQNVPANFIISFGAVGGFVILLLLGHLQSQSAPTKGYIFWPIFLSFSFLIGALNGLQIWVFFFLLLVAVRESHIREKQESVSIPTTRDRNRKAI